MRGRPNDPAKAKAKTRAHAKRAHFCDCGRFVHGNGGKSGHAWMHERRHDGHQWIGSDEWERRFAADIASLGDASTPTETERPSK